MSESVPEIISPFPVESTVALGDFLEFTTWYQSRRPRSALAGGESAACGGAPGGGGDELQAREAAPSEVFGWCGAGGRLHAQVEVVDG